MLSRKIVSDPFTVTLRGSHPFLQDLVNDPVLFRRLGPQEIVTVVVALDLLLCAPVQLCHQRNEALLELDDELGMTLDIGPRALKSTRWLMNHDGGIGEGEALALG